MKITFLAGTVARTAGRFGLISNKIKTMKISLDIMSTPWTIDTYATFTGEDYEEREIDYQREELERNDLDYDSFDWEYDHKKLVEILADNWLHFTRENIIDDVILSIERDGEATSPRYYNYSTDNATIIFEVDSEKLDAYIDAHREQYEKEKPQSSDGFMWLGDEYQTRLAWYLSAKSASDYTEESYLYDQYDDLSGNGRWDEVISYKLVK